MFEEVFDLVMRVGELEEVGPELVKLIASCVGVSVGMVADVLIAGAYGRTRGWRRTDGVGRQRMVGDRNQMPAVTAGGRLLGAEAGGWES